MTYALDEKRLDAIEEVLLEDIFQLGVHCVLLIDTAGNVIANLNDGEIEHDIFSLAALAAGNFGAVSNMAKIIGEDEFSLLFHKGEKENIHFSKIMSDFLLLTIFGKDLSLGFLRLKVSEATEKIEKLLGN